MGGYLQLILQESLKENHESADFWQLVMTCLRWWTNKERGGIEINLFIDKGSKLQMLFTSNFLKQNDRIRLMLKQILQFHAAYFSFLQRCS